MPGRSAIGLDIGTSAVRAAQVSQTRNGVVLERFGEAPLAPGAVRDGEVVDRDLVIAALKQLWHQHRLGSKKVILGVANQKVVVRQVDLPWIPPGEMRRTLPFHVQDFIPMPVEAAVLDFLPLSEKVSDSGGRSMDGLLVAASRDMVLSAVAAAEGAGLRPVAVDLSSFALVRALAWPVAPAYAPAPTPPVPPPRSGDTTQLETVKVIPPSTESPPDISPQPLPPQAPPVTTEPPPVEALVDVGASVTNVVVHRGGVPLFVRILILGGQHIADAVSERTGADPADAEETVRSLGLARSDVTPAAQTEPAARAIEIAGSEIVDEVRGSLDYYVASSGSAPVSRILLTGGGARLLGLAQRLYDVTRTAIDYGHPLAGLNIGGVRMSPEQLAYLEPVTAVAVGLARGAAV